MPHRPPHDSHPDPHPSAGWERGPARPRRHPTWRRPPWRVVTRRVRRRSARWWLSLVLAAAAGAAATAPIGAGDRRTEGGPPARATTPAAAVPPGHAALALPRDEGTLPLAAGDRVDLLATDLATGRAALVARGALVVETTEAVATIAVRRNDLAATAGAASQGLLVPVLVPPP